MAAPSNEFLPSGGGLSRLAGDVESVEVDDLGGGNRRLGLRLLGRRPAAVFLDRAGAAHLARLLTDGSDTAA